MQQRHTIATYNTRNLFVGDEATAKPRSQLRSLARAIDRLDADVLGLQEVGGMPALETLNGLLAAPYPHLGLLPGNSNRGIHVAFLSRWPLALHSHVHVELSAADGTPLCDHESEADRREGRQRRLRFQRDWLLAEVALGDAGTVAVFNGHLKSAAQRDYAVHACDTVRGAEARAAAVIVGDYVAANPARPVVVLGDFNETPSHESLAPLFALSGFSDPVAEAYAGKPKRPTTYWARRRYRIDHVLLSAAAKARYVPDSATIPTGKLGRRASDHYPVSIQLEIRTTDPEQETS